MQRVHAAREIPMQPLRLVSVTRLRNEPLRRKSVPASPKYA